MKKLMLMVSSLAAAVFSTSAANADVSVSGSYGLHMVSGGNTTGGNTATGEADDTTTTGTMFLQGGGVSFSLSTTTAGGMSISAGAGITLDSNDNANATSAPGLSAVTFAADGFSLTVGEIDIVGSGVGEVGKVASDVVDEGGFSASDADVTGIANTEGYGFNASTTVSGATVSLGYLMDYNNSGVNNVETASGDYASGLSVAIPMGSATVTLATATQSGAADETTTGGSISMPINGMTVKAGYESTDETTDSSSMSVSASGSLDADTTWAIGYTDGEQGTAASTMTEAKLSRSLGGGVSVYAEIQNTSGSTAGSVGTNIAVGTTVSF
jgi:hypothetical protein